jgi:DNA invertase Pin-like site-specific DNA recombinase
VLELARLTDTLVIDADGVYDLADFNDRLLLGLKGTMSEAELHLLAGRLQGAKRAAAQRGQLRTPLPVGYIYDDEGATVIDPDAEVQAALADVFAAFTATGRLGVSIGVVYYWTANAHLDARRGAGNRLCIPWNPATEAAARERVARSSHLKPADTTPTTTTGGAV